MQTQAREEALDAAREMVMSKRLASLLIYLFFMSHGLVLRNTGPYVDTVDLHGTTVAEAIAIVQEMLLEKPSSNCEYKNLSSGVANANEFAQHILSRSLLERGLTLITRVRFLSPRLGTH